MSTAASLSPIGDSHEKQISDVQRFADTLSRAPELANWTRHELVHLVPYVSEMRVAAGKTLCRKGDRADRAYCLVQGTVLVQVGKKQFEVSQGFVGHEVSMNLERYAANVVAKDDVVVLEVPRSVMQSFGITLNDDTLYHSFLARYTDAEPTEEKAEAVAEIDPGERRISSIKALGWFLTLIVPVAILFFGNQYGLDWPHRNFLAALSVCLLMMSFDLTPQYAAALIAGLACLLLDVAPARVILSGFASDGFFMALSIFGLGAVITASGLAERLVLMILRLSPQTPFWYNLTVMVTGIFMTPCLPSANTRVALMTPLVMETSRSLGFKDGSREGTRLMLSMFVGASFFAPVFLTAKSLNFVVQSQMPDQVREQFQWLKWTVAASVTGLIMLTLYVIASTIIFRGGDKPKLSKKHLQAQFRLLGPMDNGEWTALAIAIAFILAIVTYSVHKISPAWITLGVFCVFLMLGTLREKHIRHNFQWDVLLLVGFFIGLESTLDYMGMKNILTNQLSGVAAYMALNFGAFIVLLALVTSILRLFLPITTAGVLIASVFMPLAELNGVSPWVVGFVIIILSETWILPSQSSYFMTFQDMSGGQPVHDRKLFLRMNALSMGIRLVALFASLPFFRYMGLL
jgi:DASS family divalent anion:Na+ symporter